MEPEKSENTSKTTDFKLEEVTEDKAASPKKGNEKYTVQKLIDDDEFDVPEELIGEVGKLKIQERIPSLFHKKNQCVGCKTYFQQGDILPKEDLQIELKNYSFPIKDSKNKWNLLKTICSFLNSKGGTIYIGAEDSKGQIVGIPMQRKQQDQFKLFVQQLVKRIQPEVDLSDREEITIQYVPILKDSKFIGKFLIKVIVKQGLTNRLYCFSQKVQMVTPDNKKAEDYQVIYSYKRHNMGGINSIKGLEVVEAAVKKALNPINKVKTFHEDCNPQPPNPSLDIVQLGFRNIYDKSTKDQLSQWFEGYLKDLKCQNYDISFQNSTNTLVIQFESTKDYKRVFEFVDNNLTHLNSQLQNKNCKFVKKEVFLDCMIFQNICQKPKPKQPRRNRDQKQEEEFKSVPHMLQSMNKKNEKKQKKKPVEQSQKPSQIPKQKQNKFKNNCLTFTHIDPKKKSYFMDFLEKKVLKVPVNFESYHNSIEAFFKCPEDQLNYWSKFSKMETDHFGFSNQLVMGMNTGSLLIYNYDKKKWKQLAEFLYELMEGKIKSIESERTGNTFKLRINMNSKKLACEWLDILLSNKDLKGFKISGSSQGFSPKMKIMLECQ